MAVTINRSSPNTTRNGLQKHKCRAIESYRRGYPRLAAFMTIDRRFTIAKRFDTLHMRNILYLQDGIAEIENRLDSLDEMEPSQTYLSSRRHDGNPERRKLMKELNQQLEIYDNAVLRYQNLMQLPSATPRSKASVRNWVDGHKPLVRSESQTFLDRIEDDDFMALHRENHGFDRGLLFNLLELAISSAPRVSKMLLSDAATSRKSQDPHVILVSPNSVLGVMRIIYAITSALWLITPIVAFSSLATLKGRSILLSFFVVAFSVAVAIMARATKYDVLIAVAMYSTVLVVFFQTNPSGHAA